MAPYSFIYLFNEHPLSTGHTPRAILGAGHIAVNRTEEKPCLHSDVLCGPDSFKLWKWCPYLKIKMFHTKIQISICSFLSLFILRDSERQGESRGGATRERERERKREREREREKQALHHRPNMGLELKNANREIMTWAETESRHLTNQAAQVPPVALEKKIWLHWPKFQPSSKEPGSKVTAHWRGSPLWFGRSLLHSPRDYMRAPFTYASDLAL